MAKKVDSAGVLMDLRALLVSGERTSWGRDQLLREIARLETQNTIDLSSDEATIRRFSDHLADTALGLLPD